MGWQLVTAVLHHAPPSVKSGPRMVLCAIADQVHQGHTSVSLSREMLGKLTGQHPDTVGHNLRALDRLGYRVRGEERARTGRVTRYRVPDFPAPPGCPCALCRARDRTEPPPPDWSEDSSDQSAPVEPSLSPQCSDDSSDLSPGDSSDQSAERPEESSPTGLRNRQALPVPVNYNREPPGAAREARPRVSPGQLPVLASVRPDPVEAVADMIASTSSSRRSSTVDVCLHPECDGGWLGGRDVAEPRACPRCRPHLVVEEAS